MNRQTAKESTSNLFNRYVWLVDVIYRTGQITFEQINEKWSNSRLNDSSEDIPLRTFHNHRKAIEQMFDINIECDKRNGYTYYIENADDMERGGVRSWLLNAFAVNNLINESHKLKHRILFEQIPSGQQFLTPIIEAMHDGVAMNMTYQSYWRDEPNNFDVEPYCVKVFKQRWYLVARSPYYDKVMIYALDRVFSLDTIPDKKFKMPEEFNPEAYFYNCFGIITDESLVVQEVSVKILGNQVKYIRALPLHHSQQEVETTDDYSIFKYYIKPTYDFRQELLSHGAEFEVLTPEWFRTEITNIIKNQEAVYR